MTMTKGRRSASLVVVLALSLTACGPTSRRGDSAGEPTATASTDSGQATVAEEYRPRGINDIVWAGDVGVVGTVQAAAAVDDQRPYLDYAKVSLKVERVLYTSKTWSGKPVVAGDDLPFVEYRLGDSGHIADGLPPDLLTADRYGPDLAPGARVIVMLTNQPIETGPEPTFSALTPAFGYQSIWTLDADGLAVSAQQSRTVPTGKLLERIALERDRGPKDWNNPAAVAADELTVSNPLGDTNPTSTSAVSTTVVPDSRPDATQSPDDVTLSLKTTDHAIDALFRNTTAGGVDIAIAVDGTVAGGSSGPTAATQEGKPVVENLPDGEMVIAVVGSEGISVDRVKAVVNGQAVAVTSGTWNRKGKRPVIAFIVPQPPTHVEIDDLVFGPAISFDLTPQNSETPPSSNLPSDVASTTSIAMGQTPNAPSPVTTTIPG
jgi:hypothetical protein